MGNVRHGSFADVPGQPSRVCLPLEADIVSLDGRVGYGPTKDIRNERGRQLGRPPMFGGIEDEAVLSRTPSERDARRSPVRRSLFSS